MIKKYNFQINQLIYTYIKILNENVYIALVFQYFCQLSKDLLFNHQYR